MVQGNGIVPGSRISPISESRAACLRGLRYRRPAQTPLENTNKVFPTHFHPLYLGWGLPSPDQAGCACRQEALASTPHVASHRLANGFNFVAPLSIFSLPLLPCPFSLLPLPSSNPPSPALISCSKGSLCGLSSCDFRRRTVVLPQICFPAAKKHKSLNEAVLAMAEILDFSPVPTLVVSPSLHVRTASDGLLKAWGRGRDALVGKNLFAVLYSDPTTDRFDCIPLRHAIESAVSTRTLRVCHAAYFRTRFLGLHALHQCTELTDCCA